MVENDDLEHAFQRVNAILDAESLKRERMPALGDEVVAVIARLLEGLKGEGRR